MENKLFIENLKFNSIYRKFKNPQNACDIKERNDYSTSEIFICVYENINLHEHSQCNDHNFIRVSI